MAYLPLSTANLPDPVIDPAQGSEPRDYFETFLYTGNGAGLQVGDVIKKPADTITISSSLIFNANDSTYLNFTPTGGSGRTKFTYSGWIKISETSTANGFYLIHAPTPTANNLNGSLLYINGSNVFRAQLRTYNTGAQGAVDASYTSSIKFLDTSAWYHIVFAFDSTATLNSDDTMRLWVNGVLQTNASPDYPSASGLQYLGSDVTHEIGRWLGSSHANTNGYMAEVHFIDGTVYEASDFGNFDANGIWIPKTVTGIAYGTNGFYLDFSDNTSTTTLGEDQAGSNDWTLNGFTDTSNQVADSPTDNFMTMSSANADGTPTLSEGNLRVSVSDNDESLGSFKIRAKNAGKFYWEVDYASSAGNNYKVAIGIANDVGTSEVVNYGHQAPTYNTSNLIGIALDTDNQTIEWYKDGVSMGAASDYSYKNWDYIKPLVTSANSAGEEVVEFNFGQRSFAYTPPTGYLALSENNITVDDQNLESPDFVWIKNRDNADNHHIYDSVRGVQKAMYPDPASTLQEQDAPRGLLNFNTNGFTVGDDGAVNRASQDYVAWCWKVPTSFSNDASATGIGDIDSSGKVNTNSGVSICTYTATGSAGEVKHGLSQAPDMLIFMRRDGDGTDHLVYHSALGATKNLRFNNSDAENTNTFFGNTEPTSDVFSVDSALATTSGRTFVVYCFHNVEGFSKAGSYTGGSDAFVYLGFAPAMIIFKRATGTVTHWAIRDNARKSYNPNRNTLYPSKADVEYTGTAHDLDFLSNGFKIRNDDGVFDASATYIYMAFAENPFKYSNAR